jgi:hypothetical protein
MLAKTSPFRRRKAPPNLERLPSGASMPPFLKVAVPAKARTSTTPPFFLLPFRAVIPAARRLFRAAKKIPEIFLNKSEWVG